MRRELDCESDLMDGVIKTMAQTLSDFLAVVLQHHSQIKAA
jgi:hypothetical protein